MSEVNKSPISAGPVKWTREEAERIKDMALNFQDFPPDKFFKEVEDMAEKAKAREIKATAVGWKVIKINGG